jgi:hypothetical protein
LVLIAGGGDAARRSVVGGAVEIEARRLYQLNGDAARADVVGNEQLDQLLAVDEPDERFVLASGFLAGTLTEVAGRDERPCWWGFRLPFSACPTGRWTFCCCRLAWTAIRTSKPSASS